MKTLQKETRPLSLKETKALKKIRNTRENDVDRGFHWRKVVFALVLGALSMYGAVWTRYDLMTLLLGTFSVFSFAYVVIMPYERLKDLKKSRAIIRKVNDVLKAGMIEVTPVRAKRIAVAKEYDDEGDLYVIEMENSQILYLWDNEYNLKKNFPCLEFEIYSDEFARVIGRQVSPLSEKIKPVIISEKAKWNYLKKASPDHLQIEKKDFDKLLEKISGFA